MERKPLMVDGVAVAAVAVGGGALTYAMSAVRCHGSAATRPS